VIFRRTVSVTGSGNTAGFGRGAPQAPLKQFVGQVSQADGSIWCQASGLLRCDCYS
jgi:hypothetical protein